MSNLVSTQGVYLDGYCIQCHTFNPTIECGGCVKIEITSLKERIKELEARIKELEEADLTIAYMCGFSDGKAKKEITE